jgi:hypothetical protein
MSKIYNAANAGGRRTSGFLVSSTDTGLPLKRGIYSCTEHLHSAYMEQGFSKIASMSP